MLTSYSLRYWSVTLWLANLLVDLVFLTSSVFEEAVGLVFWGLLRSTTNLHGVPLRLHLLGHDAH